MIFSISFRALVFSPWLLLALPYLYWVDARMPKPQDGYWMLGRLLLMRREGVDRARVWNHLLGWLVKGFFLPLMFLPGQRLPTEFVPVPALSVVYLGAAITLGAYGLYSYGVSKIPASQASAFVNLIPVATLIMARLTLGEAFKPSEVAGMAR